MATGMIIDGVFASQAIDSSGEILDVEGCDISTLDKDGVLNYEHKEGDKKDPKGGNNGEEIVGKIIYAKKVMKETDCETDRQRMYWNKIGRIPFVYGMCRLYDGAGHSGAQALAAQIRDHHANNEAVLVRFSIEGSTLERHGNRLTTSVARRVAATLKPCNRTAVSGLIEDPKAPEGFEKKSSKQEKQVKDILAGLFDDKRDEEDQKKREHQHPMYSKLGGEFEVECSPLIKDEADLYKVMKLVVKARMLKALAAGSYGGAPSTLVGGAALQKEDLQGMKNRALAVLRDHGKKKFVKAEFKAILKAKLPEADDSFLDHFSDLAEDYHVKLKKMSRELVKKENTEEVAAPSTTASPKPKAVKPKVAKAPAQKAKPVKAKKEVFEEPDNVLSKEPKRATKEMLEFPPKPEPGKAAVKKGKPSLAPAQGNELKQALAEATNMSNGQFMGLSPIVRNGVELKGKALASYLGINEPAPVQLMIRGKAAPAPEHAEPHFDPATGFLHVPPSPASFNMKKGMWNAGHTGGKFKFYIPGHYDPMLHGTDPVAGQQQANGEREKMVELLNDPERTKYHDYAMKHWVEAHKLMNQGKTPEEIVAHMTGFSQLSPNTPVPMHELMYGYLNDTMNHTGIDMRNPAFGGERGHLLNQDMRAWRASKGKLPKPDLMNPQKYGVYGDWKSRDTGNKPPETAPSHWDRVANSIKLKGDQTFDPKAPDKGTRKAGQYGSYMLAQDKFTNMAKYAKNHKAFHELFVKHGPSDPREIVNHILHHKIEGQKWNNARKNAVKAGKPDPGAYPHGLVIEGLAPKTGRFAVTMAGAGNMWVPDTHMTRFNFGLEKGAGGDDEEGDENGGPVVSGDTQAGKDNDSIAAIKSVLWNERHHHLLNNMDGYYSQYSPAVDHMLQRYGEHLGGNSPEEKRRNATFGGFWKNWSAIVDHEKSRGYATAGANDYADHRPVWEATAPFLGMKKGEEEEHYDQTLPMRTSLMHHSIHHQHGEMAGAYYFMTNILPKLLASAQHRRRAASVMKMEALTIDLRKAAVDMKQPEEEHDDDEPGLHTPEKVCFADHDVIPGHAKTMDGDFALLHEDNHSYVAVPADKVHNFEHHHLVKFPKTKEGTHFQVLSRPSIHVADLE